MIWLLRESTDMFWKVLPAKSLALSKDTFASRIRRNFFDGVYIVVEANYSTSL